MSVPVPTEENVLRRPDRLFDAYFFDLDGTIHLGDQLLPGAAQVIGELRRRAIPVRFLSNNATRDPAMVAAKLTSLGLPTPASEITNPVMTTIAWLQEHHPGASVFALAEEPLLRALAEAGFRLSDDPAEIDVVIASYDRTFDYRKLQIAFDALWFHRRAILIQTNPDAFCPYPGGRGEPDCAAITAALEASTGVRCSATLGKPDPLMLTTALAGIATPVTDPVMVGDRLGTDILMGLRAGLTTVAVLTGDATPADIASLSADRAPDYVLKTIDQILPT